MHNLVYRRLGMRTSPFQMQVPILMGMCTSPLLQLLGFTFPTPVAAAPCLELVIPTSPPYSKYTPRVFYTTQDLEHFLKYPELAVPRMPLHTALQAPSGKAGEYLIGRSHQPRQCISKPLEGPHLHMRPDSAPALTATEIERLQAASDPPTFEGGDNMITVEAEVEAGSRANRKRKHGSRVVAAMRQADVAVIVRARAATMSYSVPMRTNAPGSVMVGARDAGGLE